MSIAQYCSKDFNHRNVPLDLTRKTLRERYAVVAWKFLTDNYERQVFSYLLLLLLGFIE